MIDATKFPKAARLQQQREEQWEAEQTRQKAEKQHEREAAKIAVAVRGRKQQQKCHAAEIEIAKRKDR